MRCEAAGATEGDHESSVDYIIQEEWVSARLGTGGGKVR